MRTTINLEEEVYELATYYARGRGLTLSKAMNEMVRKATNSESNSPQTTDSLPPGLMRMPNGMVVFAPTGRILTSEMVRAALEEEDELV